MTATFTAQFQRGGRGAWSRPRVEIARGSDQGARTALARISHHINFGFGGPEGPTYRRPAAASIYAAQPRGSLRSYKARHARRHPV
eukprot:6205815-Pleurochrysis_carterae.AAC.2